MNYKLAFVIERYFEFGGLEQHMRRLAAACAREGHDVTVFTGRWEGADEPSIRIEVVAFKKWTNHGTMKRMESFVQDLRRQNKYDCIVGFNRVKGLDVYYGGDVCFKARLQERNRYWLRFLPRYRCYLRQEESVFGKNHRTDLMLIAPREVEKIKRIYATSPDRIHLLPPGIDRRRLVDDPMTTEQRMDFRKNYHITDDSVVLLTVGSSFHTKGIDRAIYAIAALPEHLKNRCRYIVAGQGRAKQFKAIAVRAGIGNQVYFTGGRRDIAAFYHSADVLLHPARSENTGNALLEAMMAGLPVITTETCGYSHYVLLADAGAVCPEPFDQKQFNLLVRDFLANDRQRRTCAENGRRFCQTADIYSRIPKGVEVILGRAEKNRGRL